MEGHNTLRESPLTTMTRAAETKTIIGGEKEFAKVREDMLTLLNLGYEATQLYIHTGRGKYFADGVDVPGVRRDRFKKFLQDYLKPGCNVGDSSSNVLAYAKIRVLRMSTSELQLFYSSVVAYFD